jgi:hypothetical protein
MKVKLRWFQRMKWTPLFLVVRMNFVDQAQIRCNDQLDCQFENGLK